MKVWRWKVTIIFALVLILSACSSSQTKDEDGAEVIPPAEDAGTDAVPQPTAEIPQTPSSESTSTASPTDSSLSVPPAPALTSESPTPPPSLSAIEPPKASSSLSSSSTDSSVEGSGQFEDYTVQQDDTLMKIAFEVYGDLYKWRSIYEANKGKISDPNSIPKGVVLKVEKPATPVSIDKSGEKYLIKKGDTLGKISGAIYGTPAKWKELWEHNKKLIHDPNKIFAGFYLYYLAGDSGASSSPTSTTSKTGSSESPAIPSLTAPSADTAPSAAGQ